MARRQLTLYPLLLCLMGTTFATAMGEPGRKISITTSSETARSHFLAGRKFVDNLRLTDAIADFRKAVEIDSSFALAYLYLAQTAPAPGQFFSNLEKAVKFAAGVSDGERLWILGVRAGASGDPASQKSYLTKLALAFPDDERAHTLLGIFHFGQQEYAEAVSSYERAIKIEPSFAPAYNQLGYAYRLLERFNDAEQTFKKYTELIPNDPNPYDSYAEFLLKVGRFDDAVREYQKALAADEHFTNAYTGIAAALMYQGKHEDARAALEKAYALARTDVEQRTVLFASAVTFVDEGVMSRALQELDRQFTMGWEKHDAPAMAGDLTAIGNILLEMGKPDDALARFQKALAAIASSSLGTDVKENAALFFHYNSARVALAQKNLDAAAKEIAVFSKGAEAKKNRNQIRLAHELSGMLAAQSNDHKKAIEELLQSNLQNPYNLYRLAIAYQEYGDLVKAREYAKRAAAFNVLPLLNYALVRRRSEALLESLEKRSAG